MDGRAGAGFHSRSPRAGVAQSPLENENLVLRSQLQREDHRRRSRPGLSRAILWDAVAAAFVDGVGFHGYEGKPSAMRVFHEEFPKVPIHFTEGSVFGIQGAVDLIERLRNWATSYNAWVLMLDGPRQTQQWSVRGFARDGGVEHQNTEAGVSARLPHLRAVHEVHPPRRRAGESRSLGGAPAHVAFRTPESPSGSGRGESRRRGAPLRDPLAEPELFRSVTSKKRWHLAVERGGTIATPPKKNFWRATTGCRNLLMQFRGQPRLA